MKLKTKLLSILFIFLFAALFYLPFYTYSQNLKNPGEILRDRGKGPIKGKLVIFPLTSDYVVIGGDYDEFFNNELLEVFKTRRTEVERRLQRNLLKDWSYRFYNNFMIGEIMSDYLPEICNAFQRSEHFSMTINNQPVRSVKHGYWINAIGPKSIPRQTFPGTEVSTNSAELMPFAYIQLGQPLKNGDKFSVVSAYGEKAEFTYDEQKTVSRAIKVNQEGYVPYAGRKYAYLGHWLGGELGPLDTTPYQGREFYIRSQSDHSIQFTGKVELRKEEQIYTSRDKSNPLNGEIVMEMDFSSFSTPGSYYIQVPGVGRSWDFIIGDDALGRAFYVQMRGLFHQRSGIAKESKYTQWTMKIDHPYSFRGGFPPNDRHYKGKGSQIVDAEGKTAEVTRHFEVVKATATNEKLPNVYGGWWDAGDFDRRNYHFEIVDALLSVYLLFPENFVDNQLDIPESGNGIPDIIDEAAWGVDVWRRAQNEKGGVGCWLEATSHPVDPDPETDTQPYYLALPTRESTIQYCAYAAKLARAYRHCGQKELAEKFYISAAKAWQYAIDPANTVSTTFTLPKQGALTYKEPNDLPEINLLKAALNLYLYNQIPELKNYIDSMNTKKLIEEAKDTQSAYFLSEFEEGKQDFFAHAGEFRKMIRKRADYFTDSQEQLAYRNVNWNLGSGFFLFLAWGQALPFKKGSFLIMAWRTEGAVKYRDAALLCVDWMLGTNPMGRSMTTGLGKTYPVKLLSLPMLAWRDRLVDPIPGLSQYTFSGMNNYSVTNMIFGYAIKERTDHRFPGFDHTLLPNSMSEGKTLSQQEIYQIVQRVIPVWRRYASLEGKAVNQTEFTVWETIAPAAAAYGALLPPGWRPPPDWKAKKPEPDIKKLHGLFFLP